MTRRGPVSRSVLHIVLLLAFLLVVAVPPAVLFASSVFADGSISLNAYLTVLESSRQWALLSNSVTAAAGTAVFATLIGAAMGFAIGYAGVPGRSGLTALLPLPVLIPAYVFAIAWIDILGRSGYAARLVQGAFPNAPQSPGPYGLLGVILVQTFAYYPITALAVIVALRRLDARFCEAALLAGQGRRAFWSVALPMTMPAVLTGSLVVFLIALVGYAVPSLLQVTTYPVEIHASSVIYDFNAATAHAVPMLAVAALAFGGWAFLLRPRYAWLSGAQRPWTPQVSARSRAFASIYGWLIIAVTLVLPLGALFARSMPPATYLNLWNTAGDEILTGLALAAVSATCITTLAFGVDRVAPGRLVPALTRATAVVSFAVSGPLLGLALIVLWNRPGPMGLVYDSAAMIVLACSARYMVFGLGGVRAGHLRLDARLREAAQLSGVRWWRSLLFIELPLMFPYLIGVWGLAFILSLGEVDTTVLVCPPGVTPLTVRLFALMHYGPDSYVAALSLLTAGIVLVAGTAVVAVHAAVRRRIPIDA